MRGGKGIERAQGRGKRVGGDKRGICVARACHTRPVPRLAVCRLLSSAQQTTLRFILIFLGCCSVLTHGEGP